MLHSLFGSRFQQHAIFVPQSVLAKDAEDYALVSSVVEWLHAAHDRGCYFSDEIAKEAPQAYHANYYYSQVCNGGHAQFRHNSRMDQMTVEHALAGLQAADLVELAACLKELSDAPQMDTAALNALDDRFFAAYGDYYERMNAWLRSHVRVMPDAKYKKHLAHFLKHDRVRSQRYQDREAFRLQGMMENSQLVGYAYLAFGTGVQFAGLRPGSFATIAGEESIIWGVAVRDAHEDKMLRGMEVGERYILVPAMPDTGIETVEELITLMRTGSHIERQSVAAQCAYARKARLGTLVAFLLQRVKNISTEDISALCLIQFGQQPDNDDVVVIQRRNAELLTVHISEKRAVLIDLKAECVLTHMSARDIAAAFGAMEARHRVH